jgi:hypothetical protein
MKKWFQRLLSVALALLFIVAIYLYWRLHDRHPDYKVDLTIQEGKVSTLSVGFAARKITPSIMDEWNDLNHNYQYDETDTFIDKNDNGKFDPVWMAGFQNKRPAQNVLDDLWSRAMVIDDGKTKIALVVTDLIGLGADDIIDIKEIIPSEWGFNHIFITSTHTHSGPDVVGLWGNNEYTSGVNEHYLEFVKSEVKESIHSALQNARSARVKFAKDLTGAKTLVTDLRDPVAFDYALHVMQVTDATTDSTLGTLVSWANHPETLEDKNLSISSDFPHFVRESIERGVIKGDTVLHPGIGGTCLYVNGAIGGMMTTWSDFPIRDPFTSDEYKPASYEKAKAQGQQLALLALKALDSSNFIVNQSSIKLRAKTFDIPLDNKLYRLGAMAGVFSRGLSGWWKIRTEIAVWQLGPATFLHEPGELYPEIAAGGIEAPAGQDFDLNPLEVPPLRALMPGDYKFIIGLSNDFIGYIIPKSQWDEKFPFTYNQKEAPYGEINSVGPETAPIIYGELKEMLKK